MDLNDSDVDDSASDSSSDEELEQERQRLIAQAAAAVLNVTVTGALLCLESDPLYNKTHLTTPPHSQVQTGCENYWMQAPNHLAVLVRSN